MHESGSADHPAAVRFGDALMPETDAQDGNLGPEAQDDFFADARFAWRARAGGNADVLWRQACNFIQRDFVVSLDEKLTPKLTEILREIVGERVVIVDQEQHGVWKSATTLGFALKVVRQPMT